MTRSVSIDVQNVAKVVIDERRHEKNDEGVIHPAFVVTHIRIIYGLEDEIMLTLYSKDSLPISDNRTDPAVASDPRA
jgi:hypothetical protein